MANFLLLASSLTFFFSFATATPCPPPHPPPLPPCTHLYMGNSIEELELPVDKVDVIVSEWMGYW